MTEDNNNNKNLYAVHVNHLQLLPYRKENILAFQAESEEELTELLNAHAEEQGLIEFNIVAIMPAKDEEELRSIAMEKAKEIQESYGEDPEENGPEVVVILDKGDNTVH